MDFNKCVWCETQIQESGLTNCPNCGGTLSRSKGNDSGSVPPPAPRFLPKIFVQKTKYQNNVWCQIGRIFTLAFFWTIILPIIGIPMWRDGLRKAEEELNPLKNGTATPGTITDISDDTSILIDGHYATIISFDFEVDGKNIHGDVGNLFDEESRNKKVGDKIWVVYMPNDVSQSSIWPPMK